MSLLLLLVSASPAHADQALAEPCVASWLAPVDGQVDVPVDARFLATSCAGEPALSVELTRQDAAPQLVDTEVFSDDLQTAWPGPLEPDTEYQLVARDAASNEIVRLRFTTGDAPAVPVDEAPGVEIVHAEVIYDGVWSRASGMAETLVELAVSPGAVDPDNVVVVEGPGPGDVTAVPGPFEGGTAWAYAYAVEPASDAGGRSCLTVTVLDAAGNPSPSTTECFVPEQTWRPRPCGCAAGGGGATVGWALGAMALVWRRRGRGRDATDPLGK